MDTIEPQPAFSQFLDIIGTGILPHAEQARSRGNGIGVWQSVAARQAPIVTNTKDSGSGSLRAALYFAFDKSTDIPPVPTTVVFDVPTSDPGFVEQRFYDQADLSDGRAGRGRDDRWLHADRIYRRHKSNGREVVLDGSQIAVQKIFLRSRRSLYESRRIAR